MLSFRRNCHDLLHLKFWQVPVLPLIKIAPQWRRRYFSVWWGFWGEATASIQKLRPEVNGCHNHPHSFHGERCTKHGHISFICVCTHHDGLRDIVACRFTLWPVVPVMHPEHGGLDVSAMGHATLGFLFWHIIILYRPLQHIGEIVATGARLQVSNNHWMPFCWSEIWPPGDMP